MQLNFGVFTPHSICSWYWFTWCLAMPAAWLYEGRFVCRTVCRPVGPPLWSRLTYLHNYWIDCHIILCKYVCDPEDDAIFSTIIWSKCNFEYVSILTLVIRSRHCCAYSTNRSALCWLFALFFLNFCLYLIHLCDRDSVVMTGNKGERVGKNRGVWSYRVSVLNA